MTQQYLPLKKMMEYCDMHNIQSLIVFEKETGATLHKNVKAIIKAYIAYRVAAKEK